MHEHGPTKLQQLNDALQANDVNTAKKCFEQVAEYGVFANAVPEILKLEPFGSDMAHMFQFFWAANGLSLRRRGFFPLDILRRLMWHTMPSYNGEGKVLHRGENLARFKRDEIGVSWTTDYNPGNQFCTAKMMAGYHSEDSGGVVLRAYFPSYAIISDATINTTRPDECEYIVDVTGDVKVYVEEYNNLL